MKVSRVNDINVREAARKEIERQIKEYLNKGGKISQVDSHWTNHPAKGAAWQPRFGHVELG